MSDEARPRGLPGGIAPPAAVFVACAALFVLAYLQPGVITLPFMSPGGIGVLGMSASLFWLLIAIAKRPPSAE